MSKALLKKVHYTSIGMFAYLTILTQAMLVTREIESLPLAIAQSLEEI